MGENGAGKSTLCKMLAGFCVADEGEVHLGGQPVHTANPLAAHELGITRTDSKRKLRGVGLRGFCV